MGGDSAHPESQHATIQNSVNQGEEEEKKVSGDEVTGSGKQHRGEEAALLQSPSAVSKAKKNGSASGAGDPPQPATAAS